jgi:hypothetical protein
MSISITGRTDGGGIISTSGNLGVTGQPALLATDYLLASQTTGRNVVVNGGCEVSQVNGTNTITCTGNFYPIDNLLHLESVHSKVSVQQVSNVLNSLGATTSVKYTVLAQYTPVTTDALLFEIPIEGVNFARFQYGTANAKAGSLQFKVNASVAGTYSGSIQNYARSRSYPFTFTVAAGVDTLIIISNIAGDTGGTWVGATNAGAAFINFNLGSGPTMMGTAGAWSGTSYYGATGATNLVSQVNGSTLIITDVQLEVGTFCTTYERKLYDQVLRECQRYLPCFSAAVMGGSAPISGGHGLSLNVAQFNIVPPVPTRVPVTGAVISNISHFTANMNLSVALSGALTANYVSQNLICYYATATGITVGAGGTISFNNAAGLIYFTGAQI